MPSFNIPVSRIVPCSSSYDPVLGIPTTVSTFFSSAESLRTDVSPVATIWTKDRSDASIEDGNWKCNPKKRP
jgi:hypothetical protein